MLEKALGAIATKQGAAAAVAVSLASLVGYMVHKILDGISTDIDFLIRLVDTTCGK